MKYIFTILSILFLPILSFKVMKPKFCVNCKYFITDDASGKYGTCSLFPKRENETNYLVNGIYEYIDQHYCSMARASENMCGPEGKMYKKKYTKKSI